MVKPSVLSAADTLTDSDSGKTFFLNLAAGFEVVLPSPRAGVNFEFIIKTAPTGAYTITSSTDLIYGQVYTTDVDSATDPDFATTAVDDINFVANKAVIGDSLKLVSDGTYWYASAFCSVFDAITFD